MKKFALVIAAVAVSFFIVASVSAANLNPGDMTSCNNAKAITFTAAGGDAVDRGNANAVVWKSSNFTTVPVTLGPGEHQGFEAGGSSGWKKTGMSSKHIMGRKSVTYTSQPEFSRGDSIGDISGEVRITNTGTVAIAVSCK